MLSTAHNIFFLSQVPYLFDQRAQIKGSEGRLLRWLQDDGVPTAESRRQLPHQHQQREIPLETEHRGAWGARIHPAILSWMPSDVSMEVICFAWSRLGTSEVI